MYARGREEARVKENKDMRAGRPPTPPLACSRGSKYVYFQWEALETDFKNEKRQSVSGTRLEVERLYRLERKDPDTAAAGL